MARNNAGVTAPANTLGAHNINSLITVKHGADVVIGQIQGIRLHEDGGRTVKLTDGEDIMLASDTMVHLSQPMMNTHIYQILQQINRLAD